jgi:hypothetical protein
MRSAIMRRRIPATLLLGCAVACSDSGRPGGNDAGVTATDPVSGSLSNADGGTDPGDSNTDPTAPDGSGTSQVDSTTDDDAPKFDVGGLNDMPNDGCPGHATDATLTGTVLGPNGVIPVSGALVYISSDAPPGIPQEVYCPECSLLGCDDDETLSNPDGSFTLKAASGAGKFLVVQKGQFMRVTPIDLEPGAGALAVGDTMLPDHNDPDNGLYIPLIAVGNASYDRLEDALGKFGLGDTMTSNMEERLVAGSESFHLWDNGEDPGYDGFVSQGTFDDLVSDPTRLDDYHIIFIPCSTDDFVDALSNPVNVQNIREWTAAGGRWYVADWSNEWLQMVFPEYQDLNGWSGSVGSADNGSYDSLANVLDMGLLDWLNALPPALGDINPLNDEVHPTLGQLPMVLTTDNWSGIDAVLPVMVDDGMGGMADVSHKVWLEGPGGQPAAVHPLTVTGQFGCGKVQFTSYHAAEFFDYVGLSPQELVLIYTILEIGVCQEPLPPPQG